jgi:ADP-heptose:LPS heptosyltransferase
MLPAIKVIEIIRKTKKSILLLGGPEDKEKGDFIASKLGSQVYNTCGKFNLNQSASLVKQANKILTNDTGLMHIAAAFSKPTLSFWGNTVPEFGMYPYFPEKPELSTLVEVEGLACRPCSKLGYKNNCPKKHFHCMEMVEVDSVAEWVNA